MQGYSLLAESVEEFKNSKVTYCQWKGPVMPSRRRSLSERCREGPGPGGSMPAPGGGTAGAPGCGTGGGGARAGDDIVPRHYHARNNNITGHQSTRAPDARSTENAPLLTRAATQQHNQSHVNKNTEAKHDTLIRKSSTLRIAKFVRHLSSDTGYIDIHLCCCWNTHESMI
ncbi:hypothetical protein O0L34_g12308 [Tuta absoluta]|nr:hypothetical protein O0L34_g12308 [Tuta absoluta]